MPAPRPSAAAIVLAAALVAAAGCGGEDGEPAGRTATVGTDEDVEVVAGEYYFEPEAVVAEDGSGRFELTLDNQGALPHNLRLFDGDAEVGGTPTFPGGEARSVDVELDPGSYRMVCTVGDHAELGMVGELEIR